MTDDAPDTRINSKVARVIEDYGLDGLGAELERRWLGEDGDPTSLRDLETFFNRRLLETALSDAGESLLEGEAANLYRLLTANDVSAGMRTQAETRLEAAGLDPDAVRSDFVSHQAIHTYLRKYREVERTDDSDDADRLASSRETVQRFRSRLQAVSENSLQSLADTDRLVLDGFDVIVDVQVICRECGRQTEIGDLLDAGGCRCQLDR